jgi:rhodanese-related sulfurtransferase
MTTAIGRAGDPSATPKAAIYNAHYVCSALDDGALLIDPAAIAEQITDRHREIVVCSVSARRAIPAAEQLSRLGYDRVHHLAGGYAAWHRRTTPR